MTANKYDLTFSISVSQSPGSPPGPHTCDVSLWSQRERAHNGRVEDEVRRVLSHSAQQAADTLSNVRLWMVETGEELRDDT